MSQFICVGSVVRDDRQLDGSRHVDVVADVQGAEAALYLVVDHDGALEEADLSLELDDEVISVAFDPDRSQVNWSELDFNLCADRVELRAAPRQDGDLDLTLTMHGLQGASPPGASS